jgi:hypothetical protein
LQPEEARVSLARGLAASNWPAGRCAHEVGVGRSSVARVCVLWMVGPHIVIGTSKCCNVSMQYAVRRDKIQTARCSQTIEDRSMVRSPVAIWMPSILYYRNSIVRC